MAEEKTISTTSSFLNSFLGTGGAGTSLIGFAGTFGTTLLSNKGKEIEADYKTELAKLANDSNLTSKEFETKLAEINANRATQLEELGNERTKSTLITVAVIVLGLGILASGVVLLLKKK